MFRKIMIALMLLMVGLFAVACSAPAAEEAAVSDAPAAEVSVEEEEAAEEAEMMEEESESEEMMEDSSDEEMAEMEEMAEEDHSDDEMAEEMSEDSDMEMAAATYMVNVSDSSIRWEGSKPVGGAHFGAVAISEGSLMVEDGALTGGSIVIDMTSITNEDLSGGMADRLVGHLKSEDFFGIDTFPTAVLNILSSTPAGDNLFDVVGEMTIKDVTVPVEFVAEATETDGMITATADITLDRTDFGITYNSGSFFEGLGDNLINDEMLIGVELTASVS